MWCIGIGSAAARRASPVRIDLARSSLGPAGMAIPPSVHVLNPKGGIIVVRISSQQA